MFNQVQIRFIVKTIKTLLKDKHTFSCYYDEYSEKKIKFEEALKKDYINLKFKGESDYMFNLDKEINKLIGTYLKGLNIFVLGDVFYEQGFFIISIKMEKFKKVNHKKYNFIYHFSHKKNRANILKEGLIINHKINNFKYNTNTQNRTLKGIWFYNRLNDISNCMDNNIRDYDVYKIETKNLKNMFYDDINTYYKADGSQLKTYQKIDKEYITIINKEERKLIKFI